MSNIYETDVVIVGAGPIGIFTVFECGMMNMKCHVIDTLDFIGGQCNALYPEKPIYDIAGFPSIQAKDLIDNLEKQASLYNPVYHLGQQVISLNKHDTSNWIVETSNDNQIKCKAIIIAAGCGAFGSNRPPIEGLSQYEKSGAVSYLVNQKAVFAGKNVVIAGGGDSAVDWAIILSDIAKKLYVVHRRAKFRCTPENSDKLHKLSDDGKIELIIPYQLDNIKGSNGKLESVFVKDFDGNVKELNADYLLPFYGLSMELGPIANWGLNIDNKHIVVNPSNMKTNVEGIYAVGDISSYLNKLKLIVCGFSEAAMAAHSAYSIVYPDTAYHFEYSTTSCTANSTTNLTKK